MSHNFKITVMNFLLEKCIRINVRLSVLVLQWILSVYVYEIYVPHYPQSTGTSQYQSGEKTVELGGKSLGLWYKNDKTLRIIVAIPLTGLKS